METQTGTIITLANNNTEFYVESIMGPLLLKGEMLELIKIMYMTIKN